MPTKETLKKEITEATNVVIRPKGILAHRAQLEVDHKGLIKKLTVAGFKITTKPDVFNTIRMFEFMTLKCEIGSAVANLQHLQQTPRCGQLFLHQDKKRAKAQKTAKRAAWRQEGMGATTGERLVLAGPSPRPKRLRQCHHVSLVGQRGRSARRPDDGLRFCALGSRVDRIGGRGDRPGREPKAEVLTALFQEVSATQREPCVL